MQIDKDYLVRQLVFLTTTPSPAGLTDEILTLIQKEFERFGLVTRLLHKGGLLATYPGENTAKQRTLSGHVDTLGAMVKQVKGNGRLKFTKIGGYTMNSVEGEHCFIITSRGEKYSGTILTTKQSVHVYGPDAGKQEREEDNMEIRLDEVVKTKEDVAKLGIRVGDFIGFDPRTTVTASGFVKSRHLDDKASVAILLAVAKALSDHKTVLPITTNFFITAYEEIGHGASYGTPSETVEFLAVDMGCIGEGLSCTEYDVSICVKDSSGPYDLALRQKLVDLAEAEKIPYALDVYPYYGSDAGAALRSGANVRAALIGPGVDASHAHERTHTDALLATAKLCLSYLQSE